MPLNQPRHVLLHKTAHSFPKSFGKEMAKNEMILKFGTIATRQENINE